MIYSVTAVRPVYLLGAICCITFCAYINTLNFCSAHRTYSFGVIPNSVQLRFVLAYRALALLSMLVGIAVKPRSQFEPLGEYPFLHILGGIRIWIHKIPNPSIAALCGFLDFIVKEINLIICQPA